ncbi:hypothetical protein PC116_g27143 [Phytophthora cactorum]|uniref:Uncharacterized protein n=1 Tax=Phytophthora cactorum TaxID=29920 RepID=A0A8T1ANH5_9STRA|nr:hypothetical protein Pcac1_g17130 [Phytophthora cactorum]KAG2794348.1 hypothetical protein PC111_g22638 [Phytophthora cactorum]KAG2886565.1 hypothetical protein PC117_g25354 [Phytophthora cactorum]KAG2890342.1 hypothetical protein PC114_g17505 [Phytophthora cactorum]KAG2986485.1 hypothetical protein PC120_g23820 [Phytophthora cactorum]
MIVQLTREELVVTRGHHTRLQSPLAAISYVDVTSDDVMIVEIPCCDVTSWRNSGVLTQFSCAPKNSSYQTPGFHDYEVSQIGIDIVKELWSLPL